MTTWSTPNLALVEFAETIFDFRSEATFLDTLVMKKALISLVIRHSSIKLYGL